MKVTMLRPSVLLPEDETLPLEKRLRVLASEALGLTVRRQVLTEPGPGWTPKHPGDSVVVFHRLDPNAVWTEPGAFGRKPVEVQGPRWKPVLSYGSDIGAALDLLVDAAQRGYRVETVTRTTRGSIDGKAPPTSTVEIVMDPPRTPPGTWAMYALGQSASLAEAITLAYLSVSRTIHQIEEPCPA